MNSKDSLDQLRVKIGEATARFDWAEVTRLSKLAQRIEAIVTQTAALQQELEQIMNSLAASPPAAGSAATQWQPGPARTPAAANGEMVVEVNWSLCKINRPNAVISERKASDTLVAVMEELYAALGVDALQKLTALRVSRGPLVSNRPQSDYVNQSTGVLYVHHAIGDTGFHVLTHSGTSEKIGALREASRVLGLTPGALTVRRS